MIIEKIIARLYNLFVKGNLYVKEEGKMVSNDLVALETKYGDADYNLLVNWFLLKENMSHKKIQKLCYYAQAWSLAINDKDIIKDGLDFQAWPHGPVNVDIWNKCKMFGWRDIMLKEEFVDSNTEQININFSKDQIRILDLIWDSYGGYTADELEYLTHSEKPWKEAREGLGTFDSSNRVISKETMKEFYRNSGMYSEE